MEIMDPFAYDLLARPPPLGFDPFSYGGVMNAGFTTEQLDDYLRAVGVLPPLPPADVVVPPTTRATPPPPGATLWGAMDYAMELPATCELYAAALDAHDHPGPAVPLVPAPAAPSSSHAAAAKNPATTYDADIDASLRAMEQDPMERPSPDYLDTTQAGRMDPVARATVVLWMCDFSGHFGLGAATLHRAVSYADRFLSAAPLAADYDAGCSSYERRLHLLGAVAVYAAAKYEDRGTTQKLNARDIVSDCGFASSQEVLETEHALVAALGYRLGGPTAHTFVDHFITRHSQGGGGEDMEILRRTAHLVVDTSLFDYCFLKLLPSAVAAAAILLARMALEPVQEQEHEKVQRLSRELEETTGYKPMDVHDAVDCMYQMIRDQGFDISPLFLADAR